MSLFNPAKLYPKQIERRNRIRAKGRKHFILFRGILGFGGSLFISFSILHWYRDFAWGVSHGGRLYFDILTELVIFPTAGYFWGAWVWKKYFEDSLS